MMVRSDGIRGHISALFTIIVWGSTFVATKVLLYQFGPVEIIFLRFLLGWSFLWLIHPKRMSVSSRKTETLFVLAGLTGVTMNYLLETFALTYTLASNLAVIVSTAPLFAGIIAVFILKQRLRWDFILGFIVSIIGIYLISFSGTSNMELHLVGDLLGLAVAVVWAVYSLIVEKISEEGPDIILTTRRIFFYGILFMLPFIWSGGTFQNMALWLQPKNLTLLLGLGIVACAVSYITWNYAVAKIGSVKSNLYFYGSPVVTILFSICFLGERVTPKAVFGMVLTILGVVISEGILRKHGRSDDRNL